MKLDVKFEFFIFHDSFYLELSKICWQLEAVQTIVTKSREFTDHKKAVGFFLGNTNIFSTQSSHCQRPGPLVVWLVSNPTTMLVL